MAVATVWGGAYSVHVAQLRRSPTSSSSIDCSLRKPKLPFHVAKQRLFPKSPRSLHLCCNCSSSSENTNSNSTTSSSWDWNWWSRHFLDIEQAETFSSILKFQLEDAIEKENFQEAAKLKRAIAEATAKDSVADIMSQLKNAINEERYNDASLLCKCTGSGLVGWWAGFSKDSDDPFGRIIRVTPCMGRFVGRSYNPKQLATASPGTPLFEIYVVRDVDDSYAMQVVFLQRVKENLTKSSSSLSNSKLTKGASISEIDEISVIDVDNDENKTDKSEDKSINIEGVTEEGIKSVINFLKEKIPELKLNVRKVKVSEEVIDDAEAIKQLIDEDDESSTDEDCDDDDEVSNLDDTQPERISLEEDNDDAKGDGKNSDMKVFIGSILHNKEDSPSKDAYVRMPAEIKDVERDSFVLHVPPRSQCPDNEEIILPKVKVAAVAPKGLADIMPPDIAKAFLGSTSDKISAKVSKEVSEIVKRAVIQAQKRDRLPEFTSFNRITIPEGDLDPFEGLYVGAFGPYGTEVVQLRRKYGNWRSKDEIDNSPEVEFFEYVEAVKLTGDLNVPAGQVTFRAKLGKGSRSFNRGLYPDELGVVASYKGQGVIAEIGFKKPKWVEGELLQLNGKGMVPYVKGADLGFLFVVPEQSFLVLFNRLKLPN